MPDSYRPPHGTEPGTFHWLAGAYQSVCPVYWDGEMWCAPMVGRYTPDDAATMGWRYVGPCVPPEMADE